MEGFSTSHALVELMSEITNSLNKRKHSIGVFIDIDLRKAFDTVDHQLLSLKKILFYGIGGIALDWIKSYLSKRTQYVYFGEHESESLRNIMWSAARFYIRASVIHFICQRHV